MDGSDSIPRGAAPTPAPALIAWYDRSRRRLPWRAAPGRRPDPYAVWLSEIMLQQTTVQTVKGYFERFLARWPTVEALAAAELDQVLVEWAGLGYYARARNLHKCARVVAGELGGRFPEEEAALRALPGIGRYTAAAIAAIAFGRPAAVMDGNVERVVARYFRVADPLPGAKARLYALTRAITPAERPGDFAQAMMDLGATVCTARAPRCLMCPIAAGCAGRDVADTLPVKAPKKAKPTRRGIAWWIEREDGAVMLRRRPETGLLGGMMEPPTGDWLEAPEPPDAPAPAAVARVEALRPAVRHTFTHFHLELSVRRARLDGDAPDWAVWAAPDRLGDYALPTVMRKVARRALEG